MSSSATTWLSHHARRWALAACAAVALVAGLLVSGTTTSQAAGTQPCDIYASGGTPCVAAHSTTRALYSSYSGSLYQVRRSSDNSTRDIGVQSAGGYADAAAQDSFCSGTSCVITVIYDQSGRNNNLTQAPAGSAAGGPDNLANATAAPTILNGHKAYGVFVAPGTGYRNNHTNGIATGDNPEGMYAIFDGTHYNGGCCFDYGNAETDSRDDGNGTMEAIYFGNIKVWGYGSGNGPWIMADLENGLFSGVNQHLNSGDPTINYRYTTAIIKGKQNRWAIRGGNAQSGNLSTFYDGVRPNVSGYNPMKKQGAIILGTGGDNSKGAQGTFYEGVMTSGYPTDATEDAVQANITAAGYGSNSGGTTTGGTSTGTTTGGTSTGTTTGGTSTGSTTGGSTQGSTGGTSSGCTATYSTTNSWSGGFQGEVKVTAGSTAVNGWTVHWTLANGQTITQVWNGTLTTSGSSVSVKNADYNGTLQPSASTTFGFLANGTPSTPTLTCT
ncbi:arabinofuranosidase catalytic domain-containing protein [Streptomyces sp. NPDC049040]|uniref:arabinofuranosidase catalytic domain-containing protein n=1 Tax=Streptomyces sp. NPDC049040 TaxID=3365593 RepID=UPI00371ECCFF